MARGWPGCRPVDTLEQCLHRLRGIGAAVSAIAVAVELQPDACPHLHTALSTLADLALDEVEAAEKAEGEMRQEVCAAKPAPVGA